MTHRLPTRPAISLTLALATLWLMASPVSAAGAFRDDDGNVHEADIEWIADEGITKGCNPPANDMYCPDRAVTRGEMAAYLARATGVIQATSDSFTDTASSVFRYDIATIAAAGITKGCNPPVNDRYCPDEVVTRGQMAAFLTRAFSLPATDTDYFNDDIGSVFEGDINALAGAGVTVGCGQYLYCPDDPVDRDQMASFIRRALTGGLEPPPPAEPPEPPRTIPPPGVPEPPPGAVVVEPGESLAAAAASHPAGTTFYLETGTHRLTYVRPKDNTTFMGAPGAILSGARVLRNFTATDGLWMASGQTQHNEEKGTCLDGYTGCVHPEQLFIDGKELWQVTSKGEVEPGTWYFDYAKDAIYIGDNPAGHLVETSVTPLAFDGSATGVVIRDLVIEKYATPAQMGAIHGQTDRNGLYGHDWVVEGNELRFNASDGVALGQDMIVRSNYVHHNGRMGIGSGLAKNSTITGNEIAYNCRGTGFLCFGWGGGGVKLAGATNTLIESNYVHHNYGVGLHSDVQSVDTTFSGNNVVDNDGSGIFVEVSNGAVVTGNTVEDNGFERPEGRGSGIAVHSSVDVVVTGNRVIGNALGIVANEVGRDPGLDRLTVTGNVVTLSDGHNGLKAYPGINLGPIDVDWNDNTYNLADEDRVFIYEEDLLSIGQWQARGFDLNSSFD